MLMIFGAVWAEGVQSGGQMLGKLLTCLPVAPSVSSLGMQLGGLLGVVGLVGNSMYRRRIAERQWKQEQRLRREATAYLTLDLPLCRLDRRHFARLMSRTMATRSSFARAALLLQDNSGSMVVAGSAGMDDASVAALNRWSRGGRQPASRGEGGAGSWTPGGCVQLCRAAGAAVGERSARPARDTWLRSRFGHADRLRGGTAGGDRGLRGAALAPARGGK